MQVLLVHAHPDPDSFSAAVRDAAVRGLEHAGHDVDVLDLYGSSFRPAMSTAERRSYETDNPIIDPQVRDHADRLAAAEALLFVYPTWWFGLPAVMKGWLERVLVPGVAFHLDPESNKVVSDLRHIRRLGAITTSGSASWQVRMLGDTGRWTILRTLRLMVAVRCRTTWLALGRLDGRPDEDRRQFLEQVEQRMAKW